MKLKTSINNIAKEESQNKPIKESLLLVILGLLSFGGATGRLIFGFGFFDLLLILMIGLSIPKLMKSQYKVCKSDFITLSILFLIIFAGSCRAYYMGLEGSKNEYYITELRFFLYIPVLYYITIQYKLDINRFAKFLPYILVIYLFLWGILLYRDSIIFNLFNGDELHSIGNLDRLNGPPILILIPLLLILVREGNIAPLSLGLYTALILLIFMKTGGRTYFMFHSLPIFYLIYTKRKQLKFSLYAIALILISFLFLKEFANAALFERFLSITNVAEDTSFLYRIYNIKEMLDKLEGSSLWFGYGIGSNYEVNLYGWKMSFFLDNTFITLIYKIGIIGTLLFFSIFVIRKNSVPKDLYIFEIVSLILIAAISYHLILNPVFIYGFFLIKSYYKMNTKTKSASNESRSN